MKKEPGSEVRRLQVVEELARGIRFQHSGRFHLDDENVIDDEVEPLPTDVISFVPDLDENLSAHAMSSGSELELECSLVNVLEKAESELIVSGIEGTDHRVSETLY
jgi:hypothetical protein